MKITVDVRFLLQFLVLLTKKLTHNSCATTVDPPVIGVDANCSQDVFDYYDYHYQVRRKLNRLTIVAKGGL